MSNILVVLSSARKGRVADTILEHVKTDLETRDTMHITIADLKEINMPFFAHELAPGSPDYAPTDPAVIQWQTLVTAADAVIFLTPEYNHSLNAIQKNALDSLRKEWLNKPIVMIGYGFSGASRSLVTLTEVLATLRADFKPHPALLCFTKDLDIDGTILDETSVTDQIKKAIDEIAEPHL